MKVLQALLLSTLILFAPASLAQEASATELQYHQMLHQIMTMAREKHVSNPDSDVEMWRGAIDGLLRSLDQHSGYIAPEDKAGVSEKRSFAGIGAFVDPKENYVGIIGPVVDDAPMVKAGLKAGDAIMEVCNRETDDAEFVCVAVSVIGGEKAVKSHIPGEPGTTVRLRIRRMEHLMYVNVVRAKVSVPVIYSGTIDDDTVYVRMTQFTRGSAGELREAYNKRKAELPGQTVKYFVLDLRFNPGGILQEAVGVSDAFIQGGRLVTTIDGKNNVIQAFNATSGLVVQDDVDVLIMVNNFSASASEIVAGSAKDHAPGREGVTMVAGEKTFGKGSVQNVIDAPDGGAIKITVARYYTGSGLMIDGVGIVPDYAVSLEEGETLPQYSGVIEKLDSQLRDALGVLRAE